MKNKLFILLFAFIFISCNPGKWCAKRFPPSVTENTSTEIVEKVRDTIIVIPGDTIKLTDTIPCPELINKVVKTKSAKGNTVSVSIKNNKLEVEAVCDSLEHLIQIKDKEIKILKQRKEVQHIKEKYIPKYFLYSGIILPFLIIGILLFSKFKKILF